MSSRYHLWQSWRAGQLCRFHRGRSRGLPLQDLLCGQPSRLCTYSNQGKFCGPTYHPRLSWGPGDCRYAWLLQFPSFCFLLLAAYDFTLRASTPRTWPSRPSQASSAWSFLQPPLASFQLQGLRLHLHHHRQRVPVLLSAFYFRLVVRGST